MKRTKLLLALLSTSTVAGVIDGPIGPEVEMPFVYSESVLSGFTNKDECLPLRFPSIMYYRYKLKLRFYNLENSELVYEREIPLTEIGISQSLNAYQLYLPFEEHLNSSGLKIEMLHNLKEPQVESSEAKVYPFKEEEINVSLYRKEPYVREGVYLSVTDSELHSTESFDFTDLNEYLTVEKNNILDLSHLKFKYNCPHDFSSGDIYLKIKDYSDLFPNLNHKYFC